jgi:superfamily II DNA or RNA helicase
MPAEKLEWLELSQPTPKIEKKQQVEAAAPCPTCGWPVGRQLKTCPHCGHTLAGGPSVDLLQELDVELLPPSIDVMPAPQHWFDSPAPDSPALYHLRLQAEQLQTTTGFDRLICLDDINVDHYQHQLEAALRALRDMNGQALLADEVGLGKTIEAGIVMKELIERGLVNSVLILTPASLTWQWHEEMETKFFEDFTVLERRKQLPETIDSADRCRWIISLDRAKSAAWAKQLLAREYDLLIVDEAHKLKNHRTKAYKFVNQIQKRYVLMLTATPIHNNLMELYNLVSILRPGHLGTRRVFRDNFVAKPASRAKRRVLTWSIKGINYLSTQIESAQHIRDSSFGQWWCPFKINQIPGQNFTLDALAGVPAISDFEGEAAASLAEFDNLHSDLIKLLQQGYHIDNAWLATFKGKRDYRFRLSSTWMQLYVKHEGKLCGARIELSQGEATNRPAENESPPKRLPSRRTIYSSAYPNTYLQKSKAARQQHLAEEKEIPSWLHHGIKTYDDLKKAKLKRKAQLALQEVEQLLAQGYEIFDFAAIKLWGGAYEFVCRLKLKPQARKPRQTSERRTTARNPYALRQLLQEVMIRNRRSQVGVRFPPRQAAIYSLDFSPQERDLYDNVTTYIRQQLRQAVDENNKLAATQKMTLMTLQKELCSSPQAVARTLKKVVDKQPSPELAEALVLAWGIQHARKVEATVSLLEQYPHKTLIFTDYLPSLETLHTALVEAGYETVVLHGSLSSLEKVEAVRQFRKSAQVMISTRSGGEGYNLQFCRQMINYDLPWNPMRIEQRVGRLHRLGQKETVSIFNLSVNETIEAYILDLLAHKIRMLELVIGELDLILGELDKKRGFEGYIEEAWAGSYTEEELQVMLQDLEKVLDKAQHTYEEVHEASNELSDLLEAMDEVYGQ